MTSVANVETFSKTFTSMNILTVAAGTNTPQGGDAGHGGVIVFELSNEGGTSWSLIVEEDSGRKTIFRSFIIAGEKPDKNENLIHGLKRIRLELHGDSKAATFIAALKFALKVFELQRQPSLLSTGVNP
jgi:hypothetical protein